MKKAFVLFCGLSTFALAETADTVPLKIDISQLPPQSKLIDNVVVPVPSEIFGVLDRLGKPNWTAVLRTFKRPIKPSGDQSQIALLLGTVIAEGFIAVEAENAEEVKKIGNNVLILSKSLNADRKAKQRAQSISEAADRKDWQTVRRELDKALDDVKETMVEMQSEQISQLVSLGGWLRGTEALTAVVTNDFKPDGAELLHQPMLLDYFEKRLANMPTKIKSNAVVTKVQQGILEIRPLVGTVDGTQISEKTVKEIGRISADLVKAINAKAQ
ncbi:MAG TPA: hypothetical protein VGO90_17675 [Chthoniobacteraceae bacterium]|jgi:hypothetical protein|nr:hypothetical protein [Chthoniobacteraceae bacterium]